MQINEICLSLICHNGRSWSSEGGATYHMQIRLGRHKDYKEIRAYQINYLSPIYASYNIPQQSILAMQTIFSAYHIPMQLLYFYNLYLIYGFCNFVAIAYNYNIHAFITNVNYIYAALLLQQVQRVYIHVYKAIYAIICVRGLMLHIYNISPGWTSLSIYNHSTWEVQRS